MATLAAAPLSTAPLSEFQLADRQQTTLRLPERPVTTAQVVEEREAIRNEWTEDEANLRSNLASVMQHRLLSSLALS